MRFAGAGVLLLALPASAYVRTRTSKGTPIAWRAHCPQLLLDASENPDLPNDALRAGLERSAAAWNDPTVSCSNPRIEMLPEWSHGHGVAYDEANVVLWRLPHFCDDPANNRDEVCVSPNAVAVTTVFYRDKPGDEGDGELLQVDIEINAAFFRFGDDGSPDKIDLENTMTHEFGHVLGLDHTCYTVAGAAPVFDSQGNPVPPCFPLTRLPPEVTEATMFNFEAPGEISKRTPRSEETQGICNIYKGRENECQPPDAGGCHFVPHRRASVLGVCLALLVVCAVRRQQRLAAEQRNRRHRYRRR